MANDLERQRVLVLGDGQDAEGRRQVLAVRSRHAGHGGRLRQVDRPDPAVRDRRADQFDEGLARKGEVVREARLSGDLGAAVDAAEGRPHHAQLALGGASASGLVFGSVTRVAPARRKLP